MSRSDAHRLADMLMAADEIAQIVSRGRDAYDRDVTIRHDRFNNPLLARALT